MERIYNINNSTLKVVFGDITDSQTDVIVSSDDAFLTMGGGVSRAIMRKAGEDIYKETIKHTPAALGDVVVTGAGNLPHKYVFHTITISKENRQIRWTDRHEEPAEIQKFIIRHSIDKSLRLMKDLGLSSIAFPAIGTGAARIPLDIAAKEMAEIMTTDLFQTDDQLYIELYLLDRYNKMTQMDFIMFFEQIAIGIHDATQRFHQEKKLNENNGRNIPDQTTLIRCFMAGSTTLEQERNAFRAVVSKADNKWNTYSIKSYDYQDFNRSYQDKGHQATYNEFIAEQTDFMIFVLTGKIGDQTRQELECAASSYDREGHPHILIYVLREAFDNGALDDGVKEWIDEKQLYIVKYNDLRDLQHQISDDLNDYIIHRCGK